MLYETVHKSAVRAASGDCDTVCLHMIILCGVRLLDSMSAGFYECQAAGFYE